MDRITKSSIYFIVIVLTVTCGGLVSSYGQSPTLENQKWKLSLTNDGTISSLQFKSSGNVIPFNDKTNPGPTWYFKSGDEVVVPKNGTFENNVLSVTYDRINFSLEYKDVDGKLELLGTVKNSGNIPFQPTTMGIKLGVDTYMDHYPDWEAKYFPTLLRAEKTHFWGYFMSPTGKILVIASPDPVASWSHEYSKSWGTPPYQFEGHRVTSVNIDFMNALPLPERHPQNLWQLLPGETKTFRLFLDEVGNLQALPEKVAELTKAPFINLERTSFEKGDPMQFVVKGESVVSIYSPKDEVITISPVLQKDGNFTFFFRDTDEEGDYTISATAKNGKTSTAIFYVRKFYSWYMQKAMQAVNDYPQKASTSHCEAWYGFYTTFAGGKYFPEDASLNTADSQFKKILPAVFDPETLEPVAAKHRIQNISTMIGILVDRYQLYHDEIDLKKALKLSEYLLSAQTDDGAYRAGNTHYTSVIYIAKSLMELLEVLKSEEGSNYKSDYNRIYASVKKAIDELERNRTNVQTEGEQTFEDGMISCTALQLGAFALLQTNAKERKRYSDASLQVLEQHQCLEQLEIPDARMRSGSLRFWEAQYDVEISNNFFNSPHGWSSWTTYATYYAYLLTGDVDYLVRTFNGLDAAMQMIDLKDGSLSCAFMVNPYLEVTQISDNIPGSTPLDFPGVHYHAKEFKNRKYITGEAYVDMVSDWFYPNSNDNDIHEHFKALEEIALGKAYVTKDKNGDWIGFNCKVSYTDGVLEIVPSEDIVGKVHLNLNEKTAVKISTKNNTINTIFKKGMQWIEIL